MFPLLLANLVGIVALLSPCILPGLPFVFAPSHQPFHQFALPMLDGMVHAEKSDDNNSRMPVNPHLLAVNSTEPRPSPNNAAPGAALKQISGATAWINSPPLTPASLRGHVVLVDFWTYSCINCLRTLPYVKAWSEKYKASGLIVIGVHTPEFPFEKDEAKVRKAVHDLGIAYPVAMDNDFHLWNNFHNQYWPAHYFIDATGRLRYQHFGEGDYDESERWIRSLLQEANSNPLPGAASRIATTGASAAPDTNNVKSPETYIGYERAENFASPDGLHHDAAQLYRAPSDLKRNQWAFDGNWRDEGQIATALAASSGIVYRFHARDLHLVLGLTKNDNPIRFRVTLDGKAPGADHGADTDADGYGIVTGDRLYQLIRQHGSIQDRTFRIEFLTPGVQAYAFTFG